VPIRGNSRTADISTASGRRRLSIREVRNIGWRELAVARRLWHHARRHMVPGDARRDGVREQSRSGPAGSAKRWAAHATTNALIAGAVLLFISGSSGARGPFDTPPRDHALHHSFSGLMSVGQNLNVFGRLFLSRYVKVAKKPVKNVSSKQDVRHCLEVKWTATEIISVCCRLSLLIQGT